MFFIESMEFLTVLTLLVLPIRTSTTYLAIMNIKRKGLHVNRPATKQNIFKAIKPFVFEIKY